MTRFVNVGRFRRRRARILSTRSHKARIKRHHGFEQTAEKLHRNRDSVAVVVAVSGKVDPPSLKSGRSPDEPRARQSGSIVNQRYLRIRRPGARLIRIVSIREIKPFEVHPPNRQQHSRPADKASGLQRDVSPVTQRLPGPAGLLCLDYSAFLSYHRSS